MTVDLERNTELGYQHQKLAIDLNAGEQLLCPRDSPSQFVLLVCVRGPKSQGSIIEPLSSLYYLDARTKISFARASILGRPEIQLVRYQGTLSDEEAAALAPRTGGRPTGTRSADDPPDPPVLGSAGMGPAVDEPPLAQPDQSDPPVGGPAERAEAAAGRAEAAADRLEAAADSAEEAAGRAEAVTARLVSAHSASR